MLNVLNIADTSTEFMEPDKPVRNKWEIQTFFLSGGKKTLKRSENSEQTVAMPTFNNTVPARSLSASLINKCRVRMKKSQTFMLVSYL